MCTDLTMSAACGCCPSFASHVVDQRAEMRSALRLAFPVCLPKSAVGPRELHLQSWCRGLRFISRKVLTAGMCFCHALTYEGQRADVCGMLFLEWGSFDIV